MPFQLAAVDIQVWALRLAATPAQLEAAAQWLAADELARARRYTAERARHEFMLTRAALRLLLAGYVGDAPSALRFTVAPRGKPALAAPGARPIEFNVSHSDGLALLAFASGCALGVDVEARRPLPDAAQLVERVFDTADAARWRALPEAAQQPAFYRAWARREACAKASGNGLWADLKAMDRDADLTVHDIDVGATHAAALAQAGAPRRLAPLRWIDAAGLLSGGVAFARAA